uniref:ATP synthase F0 subunit 6 n=1 Tax=Fulvia mutica TaxID=80828 RepID=T2HGT5_FULMU|nr:ATP synthase F0 subunit 6 [Fulvia mutica]BAN79046.1 ATP synthase F0 subunit 6 [Fulvia mutica]
MVLDLFSSLDRFSGMGGLWFMVYWLVSLYFFCWVASGATYWVVSNRIEMLLLGLHKFDPGKMRSSQPFSDPGFSSMICASWLVVGYTGFLSMFPYFDDMARDPAFIYSVTMGLWWYALISYSLCSPKNFLFSIFLGPKNALYFFGMMILEAVSWMTRGFTFGARFLISGTFGACVSYVMCDMLCAWSYFESGVLNWFFLLIGAFFWNIYEVLAISFQCYLIGLLGICFCNPHPMGYSSGGLVKVDFLDKKRYAKKKQVMEFFVLWKQLFFDR